MTKLGKKLLQKWRCEFLSGFSLDMIRQTQVQRGHKFVGQRLLYTIMVPFNNLFCQTGRQAILSTTSVVVALQYPRINNIALVQPAVPQTSTTAQYIPIFLSNYMLQLQCRLSLTQYYGVKGIARKRRRRAVMSVFCIAGMYDNTSAMQVRPELCAAVVISSNQR